MNTEKNLIDKIIAEAALDSRINDGVIDLNDFEHVKVIAEVMYDMCQDEDVVNEFIGKFIEEGKYPDRQAYNKDGWLVTFPSKEYRDAAIKKGTHAISDPTHGKGGMNLYYKRKGKQRRQTQQVATAVKPTGSEPQVTKKPAAKIATKAPNTSAPEPDQPDPTFSDSADSDVEDAPKPKAAEKPAPSPAPKPAAPEKQAAAPVAAPATTPTEEPTAPAPKEAPAIEVPVVTAPPAQYADVSKKFATNKGWVAEPYGAYRDAEGNTVAVVGLSGEVVPVRSNDREEYKLFAEKNMP